MKFYSSHEDSAPAKLYREVQKREYLKREVMPTLHKLAAWEQKEWKQVYAITQSMITELVKSIRANESIFNCLLDSYGLTVTSFIVKIGANRN